MSVYLDYNSTTPPAPGVVDAMMACLTEDFGNPSSPHAYGRKPKAAVDRARRQVAEMCGVPADAVIFTSGATEANNLALKGMVSEERPVLVCSAVEHPSVLKTVQMAGGRVVPVDENGVVDLVALEQAVDQRVAVVSIMISNNETGVIQPIEACARIARSAGALFHCDATQGPGRMSVAIDADMLTVSGHKIGGPKGIGALTVRDGLGVSSQTLGAGHERGFRAGTLNVPGIVGFGTAAEYTSRKRSTPELRDALEARILRIAGLVVHGHSVARMPNTCSFSVEGLNPAELMIGLDLEGFAVSAGSACASGTGRPSHVLQAMGTPHENAIRVSMGSSTTADHVEALGLAVEQVVDRMRAMD